MSIEDFNRANAKAPALPEGDESQWWTPADIARLFGITDRAVRYHCNRLLGRRSRYRLTPEEAARVYRFIYKFGLKARSASHSLPKDPNFKG